MINLRPVSGLCNRLRAMNAAYWLAKKVNCRLNVFWRIDFSMNIGFDSLFKVPADMHLRVMDPEAYYSRGLFSSLNPFAHTFEQREKFVRNVVRFKGCGLWSITDFNEFYKDAKSCYSWLKPVEHLQKKIEDIQAGMGKDVIGVHIRRTDNEMSIKHSPTSLFVERIRLELMSNPRQRFFLATDDVPTKELLKSTFGERLFTREDVSAREDANGVVDAVIDLMLLASCRKLYGSHYSSFSEVAAAIGQSELIQLKV